VEIEIARSNIETAYDLALETSSIRQQVTWARLQNS